MRYNRHGAYRGAAMKAIGINQFGGPEQLEQLDVERPIAGPGEVLVQVIHAGINFIDVYMRNGMYRKSETYETPLPMILGMEGAGFVVSTGKDVGGFSAGDRVSWCLSRGSYAEYAVVPAWRLVRVPGGVPLSVATALMLQGMTAHYLANSIVSLKEGHSCLVHAGAGGVGQLLVQLAKQRGARVFATVGDRTKADIATERGADYCIVYTEDDFQPIVRELTDGEGVHVVYDSVGAETIERSLGCLRRRGTCVLFGASSGAVDCVSPLELAEAGSVYFTRPHLADYTSSAWEIGWRANEMFEAAASGKIVVSIDREFPLDQASRAHQALEGRTTRGKLLLNVAPDPSEPV